MTRWTRRYIHQPFAQEPGWGVASVNYDLQALLKRAGEVVRMAFRCMVRQMLKIIQIFGPSARLFIRFKLITIDNINANPINHISDTRSIAGRSAAFRASCVTANTSPVGNAQPGSKRRANPASAAVCTCGTRTCHRYAGKQY